MINWFMDELKFKWRSGITYSLCSCRKRDFEIKIIDFNLFKLLKEQVLVLCCSQWLCLQCNLQRWTNITEMKIEMCLLDPPLFHVDPANNTGMWQGTGGLGGLWTPHSCAFGPFGRRNIWWPSAQSAWSIGCMVTGPRISFPITQVRTI